MTTLVRERERERGRERERERERERYRLSQRGCSCYQIAESGSKFKRYGITQAKVKAHCELIRK